MFIIKYGLLILAAGIPVLVLPRSYLWKWQQGLSTYAPVGDKGSGGAGGQGSGGAEGQKSRGAEELFAEAEAQEFGQFLEVELRAVQDPVLAGEAQR